MQIYPYDLLISMFYVMVFGEIVELRVIDCGFVK
jgi:hypothetical protein